MKMKTVDERPDSEQLECELKRELDKRQNQAVLKKILYIVMIVAAVSILLETLCLSFMKINGNSICFSVLVVIKLSDKERDVCPSERRKNSMNKKQLVDEIADKTKISKGNVEQVVNALIGIIGDELAENRKVQIMGFGTFKVRERKAREGKNLRSGEKIYIPAVKVATFKAGKALKEKIQ